MTERQPAKTSIATARLDAFKATAVTRAATLVSLHGRMDTHAAQFAAAKTARTARQYLMDGGAPSLPLDQTSRPSLRKQ